MRGQTQSIFKILASLRKTLMNFSNLHPTNLKLHLSPSSGKFSDGFPYSYLCPLGFPQSSAQNLGDVSSLVPVGYFSLGFIILFSISICFLQFSRSPFESMVSLWLPGLPGCLFQPVPIYFVSPLCQAYSRMPALGNFSTK